MDCYRPIHMNRDPSGIRTRVTAVRGQRTRPLYDGALVSPVRLSPSKQTGLRISEDRSAGVPGLEPRMLVPETSVLPITPYPTALNCSLAFFWKAFLRFSTRNNYTEDLILAQIERLSTSH